MLAAASDAIIIGFNVRPLADARRAAEREGVEIRTYSVIYKVTEELRAAMEGMLEPDEVEEALGQAEVLELFKASRVGTIAGCAVTDGKITRSAEVRLVRDGHGRLDRPDRLAAPLQGRRPRGRPRASSAGSSSRASRTSRSATSSRPSRPSRSRRRSSSTRRRFTAAGRPIGAALRLGLPPPVISDRTAFVCLLEIQLDLRSSRPEGQAQGAPAR